MKLVLLVWSATAIALFSIPPSLADADPKRADALFKQGKKHSAAGEFAKACEAFQKSIDEDPSAGTYLNLGDCNTKQRKLNSARRAFKLGLWLAKDKGDSVRSKYARKELKLLEGRISYLSIAINDDFASDDSDIAVFIGDVEIAHNKLDKPIAVDIGLQVVTATVDGENAFSQDFRVTDEGETLDVEIRARPKPKPAPIDPVEPERFVTERGSAVPALMILGGAAAAASVGTIFALSARSRWKDAEKCRVDGCSLEDVSLGESAKFRGDVATGFYVAAGAATVVAVWVFLRRPTKQIRETESFAVGFSPRSIFVSARF